MEVSDYPVRFSVDYPDRDLNRVSTAFRIFAVIPIAIVFSRSAGAAASAVMRAPTTGELRPPAPASSSSRPC